MAATLIASGSAAGVTSVTIPTHQVGDLLVILAYRGATASVPSIPSAGGTVPNWGSAIDSGSGSSNASIVCAAVATATNHTSGTWTNASEMAAFVVRGQDTTYLGGHAMSTGSATTSISSASITLADSSGDSLLLYLYCCRTVTSWSAAPAGQTRATSAGRIACNTKDVSTTDGSLSQPLTTPSSQSYRTHVVEIRSVPSNVSLNGTATDGLGLADVATKTSAFARSASEGLGLADAATRSGVSRTRTAADGFGLSDAATRAALNFTRTATDGLGLSDAAVPSGLSTSLTAADSLGLSDVATADVGGSLNRTVSDGLGLSDVATKTVSLSRSAMDTLGLNDAASVGSPGAGDEGTAGMLTFYGR